MKALLFNEGLKLINDAVIPRRDGESLIEVTCAGICNTDLEIIKGYAGFRGIPGHEFVGRVVESPLEELIGQRVVGEINVGCRACDLCLAGDARHCASRSVLGIKGRDGAHAEYLSLPHQNLHTVPDQITDEMAVFVEPLAAALNIIEQVEIGPSQRVCVIGDGKLAQLITRVMCQTGCRLSVIGKHTDKLSLANADEISLLRLDSSGRIEPFGEGHHNLNPQTGFDIVIEASGSPTGLPLALQLVRPRGTVILKSTHEGATSLDLAPVVVNEVKIIGSRCGRFGPAIDLLASGLIDVSPLISERIPIENGVDAFRRAARPEAMKIILQAGSAE